jgi:hypothetical protein
MQKSMEHSAQVGTKQNKKKSSDDNPGKTGRLTHD